MKGLELRKKRKSLGLTQDQLAKAVGLERKTIMKFEKLDVIDESKSTILYNYFKSIETNIEVKNDFIEVMEVQVPLDLWVLRTIQNWDVLKEHPTFKLKVDNEVKDGVIKVLKSDM